MDKKQKASLLDAIKALKTKAESTDHKDIPEGDGKQRYLDLCFNSLTAYVKSSGSLWALNSSVGYVSGNEREQDEYARVQFYQDFPSNFLFTVTFGNNLLSAKLTSDDVDGDVININVELKDATVLGKVVTGGLDHPEHNEDKHQLKTL